MRGGLLLLSLCVVIGVPARASAGRTYYGWLYGTEVMPERSVELASWIAEQNNVSAEDHSSETRWWLGPLIGITDQLELALPVEIAWDRSDVEQPRTNFDRYGAELRYRLVSQDPVDAPAFVPLVRVAIERSVVDRGLWIPEADLVSSYETGRLHALVDLGIYGEITSNDHHFEFRPGAGISVLAVGDLRFGAEIHAELTLDQGGNWAVAGPNMAWSHGRTWVSAMYGIGFYGIDDAPRIQWGIAF